MEKKKSNAFLRTDWAIIEAMIRLLETRPFEEIIVQDLLEETPVTRATFYAHFHDKFEIAERMQQIFFEQMHTVGREMALQTDRNYTEVLRRSSLKYHSMYRALLKIHTSRVDVRSILAMKQQQQYLEKHAGSKDPNLEAESEIYAQVMASFSLAYLDHMEDAMKDNDYFDHLLVPVFLAVIRQEDNELLRKQILDSLPGGTGREARNALKIKSY